jgi:F-type H+-transporting ATPase subunit epsilon
MAGLTCTFISLGSFFVRLSLKVASIKLFTNNLSSPLGDRGMTLEILTPEKKIFSGEVYGVQLPGISGLFEVLDKHAPLVSALKAGKLKILTDKTNTVSYSIQSGFAEVLNNKTTLLVEGAEEL